MPTEHPFSSCTGSETVRSSHFAGSNYPKRRRGRPRKNFSVIAAQNIQARIGALEEPQAATPFSQDELVSLDEYQKIADKERVLASTVNAQTEKPQNIESSKSPRRRLVDPATCEKEYSADEIEFMKALEEYKRASGRQFPTCTEILEVLRKLGYEKSL